MQTALNTSFWIKLNFVNYLWTRNVPSSYWGYIFFKIVAIRGGFKDDSGGLRLGLRFSNLWGFDKNYETKLNGCLLVGLLMLMR